MPLPSKVIHSPQESNTSCKPALRCHSPKRTRDGSTDRRTQRIAHFFLFPCDAITGSLYIFQKKVDGTTLSPFHSTALCHLSGNFAFRPPAALLPLGAESWSTGLLQSSGKQTLLSKDRNLVYRTKWPHERAWSGEYWG